MRHILLHPLCMWMATLGFITITLVIPPGLPAQITGFQGQPVISTGGNTAKTDDKGTVVDVYVYNSPISSGSDICALIYNTWNTTGNQLDATMDARGFVGSWDCSQSPFPNGAHGRLLLGNVWVNIKSTGASWSIPSGVEVVGLGPSGTPGDGGPTAPVNTVIGLDASLTTFAKPIVQMGVIGGSTGVRLKGVTVDCKQALGCIGVENKYASTGSTVEDVAINSSPSIGLHIAVGDTAGGNVGAGYSGPYKNVTVQYPECLPNLPCTSYPSDFTGVLVDCTTSYCLANGSPIVVQLDAITATAVNINGTQKETGIEIEGVPAILTNSHVEYYKNGSGNIVIGRGTTITNGVKLENISIGGNGGAIYNGYKSTNLQLVGISSNLPGAIVNNYYPDNVLHQVSESNLGYFMLGPGSSWTSCAGGQCAALLTTYPRFRWRLPAN